MGVAILILYFLINLGLTFLIWKLGEGRISSYLVNLLVGLPILVICLYIVYGKRRRK